jgi:hypothetical protein
MAKCREESCKDDVDVVGTLMVAEATTFCSVDVPSGES